MNEKAKAGQGITERFTEGVIEAGWLFLLTVLPLMYNPSSLRVFEPDKIALGRSVVLVMLAAWLVKLLAGGRAWAPLPGTNGGGGGSDRGALGKLAGVPFLLPAAFFASVYILSSLVSVLPDISWRGSYHRLQGTYTTLSFVAVFLLVAGHLRRPVQLRRILFAIFISSSAVALYGILQHHGLDPMDWGGADVEKRSASTLGNSIFMAALLLMPALIALDLLISRLAGLLRRGDEPLLRKAAGSLGAAVLLALLLLAMLYSGSRGPMLGLLSGAGFYALFKLLMLRRGTYSVGGEKSALLKRWLWLLPVLAALGLGIFLTAVNPAVTGYSFTEDRPYLSRFSRAFDMEGKTARVRTLIWSGIIDMLGAGEPLRYPDGSEDIAHSLRPLLGYGPETLQFAYNRFYPPELAHYEKRRAAPDRSHNETYDALAMRGLLGGLSFTLLFVMIFYRTFKALGFLEDLGRRRTLFASTVIISLAAGALLAVLASGRWFMAGLGAPAGLLMGATLFGSLTALRRPKEQRREGGGGRDGLLLAVAAALIGHYVELQFGIATGPTKLYFWGLLGVLAVLSSGLPEAREEAGGRRPETLEGAFLGLVSSAVVFTLAFDFLSNPRGLGSPSSVLIDFVTASGLGGGEAAGRTALVLATVGILLFALLLMPAVDRSRNWPYMAGAYLATSAVCGSVLLYLPALRLVRAAELGSSGRPEEYMAAMAGFYSFYLIVTLALVLASALLFTLREHVAAAGSKGGAAGRWLMTAFGAVAVVLVTVFLIEDLNLRPIKANVYLKQGQTYDTAGEKALAIEAHERAVELDPDTPHNYFVLASTLLGGVERAGSEGEQVKRMSRAADALETAHTLNPLNTDHPANLGRLYQSWAALRRNQPMDYTSKLEKSRRYFERAIALSPTTALIYNEYARVLALLERYEEAFEVLEASLELDDQYASTYLMAGDLHRLLGTKAMEGSAPASVSREHLKRAADFYRRALAYSTENELKILRPLAHVHYLLGEHEKSVEVNRRILNIREDDYLAHTNIANAYQTMGMYREALKHFIRARSLAPRKDIPEFDRAIRTLQPLAYQEEMEERRK